MTTEQQGGEFSVVAKILEASELEALDAAVKAAPEHERERMLRRVVALLLWRVVPEDPDNAVASFERNPEILSGERVSDPEVQRLHDEEEIGYATGDTVRQQLAGSLLDLMVTDEKAKPYGTAQSAYDAANEMGIPLEEYLEG